VLRDKFKIFPRMRHLAVVPSVRQIRGLLKELVAGRPLLQVNRSCRFTIDAFAGGYRWDVKKDEPEKDQESWYDDIADAVRYWVSPSVTEAHMRRQGRVLPLPARHPV
jgi:hypothetical protein